MNRHVTGTDGRTAFAVGSNIDERLQASLWTAMDAAREVGVLEGERSAAKMGVVAWDRAHANEMTRARTRWLNAQKRTRTMIAKLGGRK